MQDREASTSKDLSETTEHGGANTGEKLFQRKEAFLNAKLSDRVALGTH